MELREYQKEIITQTEQAYKSGFNSPCIVLGCGGGKSIITAEIAKKLTQQKKYVLFLVHRKELIEQIKKTFTTWGVVMFRCDIKMVQSLHRQLDKFPKNYYDYMIIDENHHSLANTYKKIINHFDCKRVGVTATPTRLNGDGLGDINDILIEGVETKWLISNKYLAPYDYYAPPLINTANLKVRNGEFIPSELNSLVQMNKIYGDVITHYKKLADGKQTIIYCHSVDASKEITENLIANGFSAAHVDAKTSKLEREKIINKFAKGEITFLSNVDLFGEGLDVPNCECVILLRPTMSLTLHIQQSMRCMRYKKNKKAIIIDHVGNVYRHGLPDDKRQWSLDKKNFTPQNSVINSETHWLCPACFALVNNNNKNCTKCNHPKPKKIKQAKEYDTSVELKKLSSTLPLEDTKSSEDTDKNIPNTLPYDSDYLAWNKKRIQENSKNKKKDISLNTTPAPYHSITKNETAKTSITYWVCPECFSHQKLHSTKCYICRTKRPPKSKRELYEQIPGMAAVWSCPCCSYYVSVEFNSCINCTTEKPDTTTIQYIKKPKQVSRSQGRMMRR